MSSQYYLNMQNLPQKKFTDMQASLATASFSIMDRSLPMQQIVSTSMPSDSEMERNSQSEDPEIVGWDGPDDPENPLNWPESRKRINLILSSILTVIS